MAFTPKIPLRLQGAHFDTITGLVVLQFTDGTPDDEPNPVDWKPAKTFTVSLQPTTGLDEVTQT